MSATEHVRNFSDSVEAKFATAAGEPEAALRGPFEQLLVSLGVEYGLTVVCHDEAHLSSVTGAIPDYAIEVDGVVVGYVELKAPGVGANTSRFTGRNRRQWDKLSALPNLVYTDGTEWAVYHQDARHGDIVRLDRDVRDGNAVPPDEHAFSHLARHFLTWAPAPPATYRQLAESTARLCRLLRDEVADQLATSTQLQGLAGEWRDLLFPDADDAAFANQYAQTVTFALLLARADDVDFSGKSLPQIALELGDDHSLLGRALQLLTDRALTQKLASSLEPLQQVVGAVDWHKLKAGTTEPWIHFYEHFLEIYDPELRKATGSYYTPDEVVTCIVRLVDEAIEHHLGVSGGLANDQVTVVDPAVGTGTFLLRTVDLIADRAAAAGPGYVSTALESLPPRLIGFELQTGPYAVAQLRLFDRLNQPGTNIDAGSLRLYVADTLDNPHVETAKLPNFYEPISRSRRHANDVKASERVLAIIANPPYRSQAKGQGGWIENGDGTNPDAALLNAFLPPDGHRPSGNQLQEMRNLYVYFWRWAIHKAFEAHPDSPHGVIGFITPSAWLTVDGLVGMRHYLRGVVDHLYVIDLGGDNRGARKEPNVFAIQTPVAITIAVRDGSRGTEDASVWYRRIRGDRLSKLAQLHPERHPEHPHAGAPILLDDDGWQPVVADRAGTISAAATPIWSAYPDIEDLVPWAVPGIRPNRTWVYAPDPSVLKRRWDTLVNETDAARKEALFRPSYHATFEGTYPSLPGFPHAGTIKDETGPAPDPQRVVYRAFDRQWILPDRRLLHSPSPALWTVRSEHQVILSYNQADPNGRGLPLIVSAHPIDQGHFNSRNDHSLPLWRDAQAKTPNVTPGLLTHLTNVYGREVPAPDLYAYIVAVTAHPGFVEQFWDELEAPGLRIPVTAVREIFDEAVLIGRHVMWLHTFGERFADPERGRPAGPPRAPQPLAPKVEVAIPTTAAGMPETMSYDPSTETLHVGDGRIANVPAAVTGFEVSGMNVVEKWFSYRRRNPAGRQTSELDQINATQWTKSTIDQLLDLLHMLRLATDLHEQQSDLLERACNNDTITVEQLAKAGVLPVPKAATRPLAAASQQTLE